MDVDAAYRGQEIRIARIPADFGVIVVRLRVDQDTDVVKCLLDPKAPPKNVGLRERAPDCEPIRNEIRAQQFTNVEVSVFAKVAVDRGIAIS